MTQLELYDPDPASLLPIARAQPDIIRSRETDLDREMRPQTTGISELLVDPVT
jgi:hypothetical protein